MKIRATTFGAPALIGRAETRLKLEMSVQIERFCLRPTLIPRCFDTARPRHDFYPVRRQRRATPPGGTHG